MKRTIRLIVALAIVTTAFSSCKTKQKIAEVPAGANVEATSTKSAAKQSVSTTSTAEEATTPVAEVTKNETFSLVEGDAAALRNKYHVVVGSFSKQENAKKLCSTLKSEGNKALVVVNETGMYRVLIASFNDYNQAHNRISQISDRFKGAWVLVQK